MKLSGCFRLESKILMALSQESLNQFGVSFQVMLFQVPFSYEIKKKMSFFGKGWVVQN
jgi:hypothetical protein